MVNSISSTSNCYIPINHSSFTTVNEIDFGSIEVNDPISYLGNYPIFKDSEHAARYGQMYGNNHEGEVSKYTDGDVEGYIHGHVYPTKKLITGCLINGFDTINHMYRKDWKHGLNDSSLGKIIAQQHGEIIKIKILGANNPIFDITIKDSSGYTILDKRLKNVEIDEKGVYYLNQKIPQLPSGKTSETYDFKLTPSADTSFYLFGDNLDKINGLVQVGVIDFRIYQYKNPTFTFTKSNSTITNCSTTGDDVTVLGAVNRYGSDTPNFSKTTHTTTLTRSSGTDNYYISKQLKLKDLIIKGNVIKKRIVKPDDVKDVSIIKELLVEPSVNLDSNSLPIYNGDLEKGMKLQGKVEKTKTIRKSIDLDIHKEPCDDVVYVDILTNKFEVDNTTDLFSGMIVTGDDFVSELESIDCERGITLTTEHIIKNGTPIVFSYSSTSTINEVTDSNGRSKIMLSTPIRLPHGTELTFENANDSKINGSIKFDYSGNSTIVLTTEVNDVLFGQEDITFTLDPNLFVTNKPNACDQHLIFGKNTTNRYINFVECDDDYNKYSKTITITKDASNGTVASATKGEVAHDTYKVYTPNTGFVGNDEIRFTVSDGVNSSEEKTIYINIK